MSVAFCGCSQQDLANVTSVLLCTSSGVWVYAILGPCGHWQLWGSIRAMPESPHFLIEMDPAVLLDLGHIHGWVTGHGTKIWQHSLDGIYCTTPKMNTSHTSNHTVSKCAYDTSLSAILFTSIYLSHKSLNPQFRITTSKSMFPVVKMSLSMLCSV